MEDEWQELKVNEVALKVSEQCARCKVPTATEEGTFDKDNEPTATLKKYLFFIILLLYFFFSYFSFLVLSYLFSIFIFIFLFSPLSFFFLFFFHYFDGVGDTGQ